jgi:hypothetical protein
MQLVLRGVQRPSYVFAAKRSCILSCPQSASRVFSQLHLPAWEPRTRQRSVVEPSIPEGNIGKTLDRIRARVKAVVSPSSSSEAPKNYTAGIQLAVGLREGAIRTPLLTTRLRRTWRRAADLPQNPEGPWSEPTRAREYTF